MKTGRYATTRVLVAIGIFAVFNAIAARMVNVTCGVGFLGTFAASVSATGVLLGVVFLAVGVVGRHRPELAHRVEGRFMLLLGWAVSVMILAGIAFAVGRIVLFLWSAIRW